MSGRPSPDALDAELTHHVEEQARIADALLELERHPGHRLLATAALTGVTASRWVAAQGLLASLWADLATYRVVVADACAVRTRRPRPGEREWAELHELLVVRPVGPPARGSALAESVTLAELAVRMDGRLREVAGVLEAAETVHLAALAGLGPLAERVRDAQARARELLEPDDPDGAALAALACAVDARLATCTNDPLSLPARLPRDLVDGLAGGPGDGPDGGIDAIEDRLAERAAARDAWADRRRAVADAIAALDALCDREAHARRAALDRVAGVVFAAPPDPRPALRRRLAGLPAQRPDAASLGRVAPPRRGRRHCVGRRAHRHRPRDRADRPARRARGAVRRLPGEGAAARGVRRPAGRRAHHADPRPARHAADRPACADPGAGRLPGTGERGGGEAGMTGAAQPGATGTAVGAPCAWDDCAGALEADGFCDTCGRSAPPAAPAATALPLPRPAPEGPPTAAAGPQIRHGAPTAPVAGPRHGAPTDTGAMPERHAAPTVLPAGPQHGAPTVLPTMAPPGAGSGGGGGGRWSGPLATGPSGSTPLRGAGTDDIPPVPRIDPSSALLRDPQVPERDRYCRHGGTPHPVGRGREGRPGLLRGFCPQDGTPYSFAPPLAEGSLVAGQYEVRGALAHGGLGWIYLAVDRNVDDRWVVLKGVLDANDPAALAAARAERQFLAQLSHPNIVAIHNFVRHVDDHGVAADYIVMAYIGGSTLAQVRDAREEDGVLPVAHALTYMIKVLPALGYLHAEGHVYSDFKPDNVMQCERHLTLIDMGAVARIDDADAVVYGTVGYHAPEVVRAELSPASDLYTVGRTLAVLALGIEPARGGVATELPDDHPLLRRHESLHRLLLRATHPDPRYRFGSADEMAEQLDGVRREVLAVDEQRPRPGPSGGLLRAPGHVRRRPAARPLRPWPARARPGRRPAARTARRRARRAHR